MDRHEINVELASRLVAEQFPQWADLPVVPVALNGWDNTTFRLGSGYPWSWSIYRWLTGTPASEASIADLARFASQLAEFLNALYAADTSQGPTRDPSMGIAAVHSPTRR
jgi:aminoglycoside phosphotransferase (APT) family kinase protein